MMGYVCIAGLVIMVFGLVAIMAAIFFKVIASFMASHISANTPLNPLQGPGPLSDLRWTGCPPLHVCVFDWKELDPFIASVYRFYLAIDIQMHAYHSHILVSIDRGSGV